MALCFDCRDSRLASRIRTPKYRNVQRCWNMSPAAKVAKQRWRERNLIEVRARKRIQDVMRQAFRRRPTTCSTLLCLNTFVRMKGSRRIFCDDCARIFYGPKYVITRGVRTTPWKHAAKAA